MSPKPQVEHSEYAERTAKVRLLCQGDPIDVAKIEEQFTADDFEVFGVEGAAEMYDLIKITAASLLDDPDAVAIRNALGLGATKVLNLTERRAELLETVDITMRALQSREAKGAELLVRQMEVMQKLRPDVAEGIDIAVLVSELEGLKSQVNHLAGRTEFLLKKLEDTMVFAYAMRILIALQMKWCTDDTSQAYNQLLSSVDAFAVQLPDLNLDDVERGIFDLMNKLVSVDKIKSADEFERDRTEYVKLLEIGLSRVIKMNLIEESPGPVLVEG